MLLLLLLLRESSVGFLVVLCDSHTTFLLCHLFVVVRCAGRLGDLNPTPWAVMLGNCCGWVTYSILINNLFVFFG